MMFSFFIKQFVAGLLMVSAITGVTASPASYEALESRTFGLVEKKGLPRCRKLP